MAKYLYLKVADQLEAQIKSGQLSDGEQLPGERDFAKQLGVSIGTARHAVQVLEF
jgi:DNA-binding GntR family transcriptional regulator